MALKAYSGSCHCGAVRFEADIDLDQGTFRCNCSLCAKARAWFAFIKADQFRLLKGGDALVEYQWTPPGKPGPFLHYHFCKHCGVRAFARPEKEVRGVGCAVSVAALDDVDPDALAASIHYIDGRHDHFDKPPEDTRLL